MKNILPQIAFTVCATIGSGLIDNEALANIDRSYDPVKQYTLKLQARANDINISKKFADAVVSNNPVKMEYSNNKMSQICNDISQTIKNSGYVASCLKDNREEETSNTLDIYIADTRLEKFTLDTSSENHNETTGKFKRAVYLDVMDAYKNLRREISQMYLDAPKERQEEYKAYIKLFNPQ